MRGAGVEHHDRRGSATRDHWTPTQTTEVTMYRLQMESCLLLGAALLAACSDRNTPTAPAARPLAATAAALVDRPYTWSFTCHSNKIWTIGVYAGWSGLAQNGVTNDGPSQSWGW